MFFTDQFFQTSLTFQSKARSQHFELGTFGYSTRLGFTWVGSTRTAQRKQQTHNACVNEPLNSNIQEVERGEISCQFLPTGGSIGLRYASQLLINEKSQNC